MKRPNVFYSSLLTAVLLACLYQANQTTYSATPAALEQYNLGKTYESQQNWTSAEQAYRKAIGLDPYDSFSFLRLADVLQRQNRLDEALQLYQQALSLNPNDSMIHLSIAQIFENKGQYDKALVAYNNVLKTNPDYTFGLLGKARSEKALGQTADAIIDYQNFLKVYPKHTDAQRELATLLLKDKQYSRAAQTYESLKTQNTVKFKDDLAYGIALNNDDKPEEALKVFATIATPSGTLYEQQAICYEKLNRLPEAYDYYQKAYHADPKAYASLQLKLADLAGTLNKPDDVLAYLQGYLKTDPNNVGVIKSIADLYAQKKQYDKAIPVYQKALKATPNSNTGLRNEILKNLGFAAQMKGDQALAISSYENVLSSEENDQTRQNLALAYHQQGEYEKALVLYRKLLMNNPQDTNIRKDMGNAMLALADNASDKQDYTTAMRYYNEAFLLGPDLETKALMGMANTQYALKNYDVAYQTYDRILEKDPNNVTARMNKAQLDLDSKNYMEALENLRWVTEKRPDSTTAYKLMASAYTRLGDYGNAILAYQKALSINSHDANLLLNYGNTWRQLGDVDRALKAYELARTESPENAMIRYNLGSVYNLKNKLEASLAEYKAALQFNPSFTEPYYGMGTTFEKQKKYAEALDVYQQYIQKAPASATYIPQAKQRVGLLKKALDPSSALPTDTIKSVTASKLSKSTAGKTTSSSLKLPSNKPNNAGGVKLTLPPSKPKAH